MRRGGSASLGYQPWPVFCLPYDMGGPIPNYLLSLVAVATRNQVNAFVFEDGRQRRNHRFEALAAYAAERNLACADIAPRQIQLSGCFDIVLKRRTGVYGACLTNSAS